MDRVAQLEALIASLNWLRGHAFSIDGTVGGQQFLMQILRAGTYYFALVFGAGFGLGLIRVLWLVPRLGERTAELVEMPVMAVVIILAAWWVARRFALSPRPAARLGVGLFALFLLLAAEFTVVLWVRGLTIAQYLASRDAVAGAVYVLMLGVFAAMPLLVARK